MARIPPTIISSTSNNTIRTLGDAFIKVACEFLLSFCKPIGVPTTQTKVFSLKVQKKNESTIFCRSEVKLVLYKLAGSHEAQRRARWMNRGRQSRLSGTNNPFAAAVRAGICSRAVKEPM